MEIYFNKYSNPFWKNLGFINSFLKKDKLRRGINALSELNRSKRFIESYSFYNKSQLPKLFKDSKFLNESFETLSAFVFINCEKVSFHCFISIMFSSCVSSLAFVKYFF